jgi:hypothetical protein
MVSPSFSARYTAATAQCGGRCPIEAGVLGPVSRNLTREVELRRATGARRKLCGAQVLFEGGRPSEPRRGARTSPVDADLVAAVALSDGSAGAGRLV